MRCDAVVIWEERNYKCTKYFIRFPFVSSPHFLFSFFPKKISPSTKDGFPFCAFHSSPSSPTPHSAFACFLRWYLVVVGIVVRDFAFAMCWLFSSYLRYGMVAKLFRILLIFDSVRFSSFGLHFRWVVIVFLAYSHPGECLSFMNRTHFNNGISMNNMSIKKYTLQSKWMHDCKEHLA